MAKGKSVVVTTEAGSLSVADLIHASSITTSKLYGKNYLQWGAAITTFLTSKEKLKFIEEPQGDTSSSDWVKDDVTVCSWLWNTMEPHISCDYMPLDSAYAVWSYVRETFTTHKNTQRMYELCEEVFHTKQGSKSFNEYYSFVKARWKEFNLHQPNPPD